MERLNKNLDSKEYFSRDSMIKAEELIKPPLTSRHQSVAESPGGQVAIYGAMDANLFNSDGTLDLHT